MLDAIALPGARTLDVELERKLDFMIVGAQKSATTALYDFLGQHPDVFLPRTKEIHYFVQDEFYEQGSRYLDLLYRELRHERLVGSAYAHMMYFPVGAERLHRHNPEARVLAVLRNPIDRAYSSYWFARRNGWESLTSFEDAIAHEAERTKGTFEERAELTYITHGLYAEQLEPYLDLFGLERTKVVLSEDLLERPEATVAEVLVWLGLEPDLNEVDVDKRVNVSGMPRWRRLHHFLQSPDVRRRVRRVMPPWARYWFREYLVKPLLLRNVQAFDYPPMSLATRRQLQETYAEPNRRLQRLLGRDLSHWV